MDLEESIDKEKEEEEKHRFSKAVFVGKVCAGLIYVGFTLAVGYEGFDYKVTMRSPKKLYPTIDYDGDGIQDGVIELNNGKKIPMFGERQKDGSIHYITSHEKYKSDPNYVIDSKKLEDRLNR